MRTIEEMVKYLSENEFRFLNLHHTDIFGGMHTITLPVNERLSAELHKGIPFDSSSIPGFGCAKRGDMALMPAPDTFFEDCILSNDFEITDGIGGVICNIVEADTLLPFERDPRSILSKAEKLIEEQLQAQSLWLPELEFFLFDDVELEFDDFGAYHRFCLNESLGSKGNEKISLPVFGKAGYHAPVNSDTGYGLRNDLVEKLEAIGFQVRYHHHEVSIAQHEIELFPQSALRSADGVMLMKYFIRNLAPKYGFSPVFLPKPLHSFPGNGMHFHQSLIKDGRSLFWDENGKYVHLSEIAMNYIAGLLAHAPALTAITNPSTNSYRRLVPGFEAPTKLFFGLANRSAAIRIPRYVDTPEDKRIEYRPPDPTANPYLAIAAMLLAGLDGIRKKMDPTQMGFGPIDEDLSHWSDAKKKKLKSLPDRLSAAAMALMADKAFLVESDVFPEILIDEFANALIKDEEEVSSRPNQFEIAKYLYR